ncbi:MAG: DEAD/DEAH box helicase, partial [Bdellovibrionota bacterium]
IQQQAIPLILQGHDLLGIAQTGTGKTAAFCLPILNLLSANTTRPEPRCPRVLILTPTRELAIQIHQNLQAYGRHLKLRHAVIFGGVSQNRQVNALQAGVDVLVATPGRLLDLIQQRHLRLSNVGIFVLDEADRMLDMGFMRDIKKIIPLLPPKRHNLFFSATMPKEIQALANTILRNPKKVEVTPPATTVKLIEQSVMYVTKAQKLDLLVHLLKQEQFSRTLVFVEMKHIANKVTEKLLSSGIKAMAIHGNKSQNHRQAAIQQFSDGQIKVLVATDIASRGIDIDGITHVINYELSNLAESYVHRIGRTARAGATGVAISLVTGDEKSYLASIERTTNQTIAVNVNQPYHSDISAKASVMSVGKAKAMIEGQRNTRSSGGFRNRNSGGRPGGNSFRPKRALSTTGTSQFRN